MHSWWERYLFWYEMHDEIRAVIGSVGLGDLALSCIDDCDEI